MKYLKEALSRDADRSDCRNILRHGSHSFYAASLLMPDEYCEPITALYAFCRIADDAVDLAEDPALGLTAVRDRLDRVYAGRPIDSPVDRTFAEVVRRYRIPMELPAALIEGFEWDVEGRRYETMSDAYAYCTRVAGTVGVMMSMLMGVRDTEVLSRACDLGVAMQLTNIARDVGEDARNGRIYLPLALLRDNGINIDAWLSDPQPCAGVERTLKSVLAVADRHYQRSEWGISQLPLSVRPSIFAAQSIYAEIGREVERNGYDSVTRRAYVSKGRKAVLLARAIRKAFTSHQQDYAPPLRETRFLLDAVAQTC